MKTPSLETEIMKTLVGMQEVIDVYTKMTLTMLKYLKEKNEQDEFLVEQLLKLRILETPPPNRKHWRDILSTLDERIQGVEQYVASKAYRNKKEPPQEKTYDELYKS